MASRPPASTCPSRNRADSGGPAKPSTAKQSTGMVVIRPAAPLEIPSPASSSSSTGPTLFTAVRRLSPVRTMATPMSSSPRGLLPGGAGELTGGSSSARGRRPEPGSAVLPDHPGEVGHRPRHPPPEELLHEQRGDGRDQDAEKVDAEL